MPTPARPKRPRDINQIAFQIVQESTGQVELPAQEPEDPIKAAAAALGRRGGIKGGPARANKLSPEERRKIAQIAAKARWKRQD
jgi:hypothetical protein